MPEVNCTRTDEIDADGNLIERVEGDDCLPTVASTPPCDSPDPDNPGMGGALAVVPVIGRRIEFVFRFTNDVHVDGLDLRDGAGRVDVEENPSGEAAEIQIEGEGFLMWPIRENGTGAARVWMEVTPDGRMIIVVEEGTLMLENKDKTKFNAGELFVKSVKITASDRIILDDGKELSFDSASVSRFEFYPSLYDAKLDADAEICETDVSYDVRTAVSSLVDDESLGEGYSILSCELQSIEVGTGGHSSGLIAVMAVTIAVGTAGKQITRIIRKILPSKKD